MRKLNGTGSSLARIMRPVVAGVLAIAVSAQLADAADRPVAMPVKAPAAVIFDWSGFYAGVNAGYGWGRSPIAISGHDDAWVAGYPEYFASAGRTSVKPDGFLGGVQAGYNVLAGSFLWGIEGDAQYMRLKASRDTGEIPGAVPNDPLHNIRYIEKVNANNFFTLRLRGGIVSGPTLLYATGGLAVTRIEFSRQIGFPNFGDNYVGSVSSTRTGWTAGGGLEYAAAPGWTAKAEYLYADFGSVSLRGRDPAFSNIFIDSKAKLSTHILRFGINRKL